MGSGCQAPDTRSTARLGLHHSALTGGAIDTRRNAMSAHTGDTHNIQDGSDRPDPAAADEAKQPDTTDDQGRPVDNPSGG